MPVMLGNGEILIFDNGVGRKFSRIVQVNPKTEMITWEYKSDPPKNFFSQFCGNAQRLPNGNTLVANADNGHAFEVTHDGEMVWEFFHFEIVNNRRRVFYRFRRYPEKFIRGLLRAHPKAPPVQHYVKNNSFEQADAKNRNYPRSWEYEMYNKEASTFSWEQGLSKSGNKCVKIVSTEKNDAQWFQYMPVTPHTTYRLSGWVKTGNIPPDPGNRNVGANLTVTIDNTVWPTQSPCLTGTNDWTHLSVMFHSDSYSLVKIQCRLGFFRATTTGTAWYDDIMLEKVE
jgi:hypothetical protein